MNFNRANFILNEDCGKQVSFVAECIIGKDTNHLSEPAPE